MTFTFVCEYIYLCITWCGRFVELIFFLAVLTLYIISLLIYVSPFVFPLTSNLVCCVIMNLIAAVSL